MNLGVRGGMVVAAVVAAIATLAPAAAAADSEEDVEAVYCLNDVHRPEVVLAAVHLDKGAVVPGRPSMLAIGGSAKRAVSLEDWRRQDRDGFKTVCSALIKANSINPGGTGDGAPGRLYSALLVVLGAVLAMLATIVERTAQHRRERLDALAAAIDDFRGSAEDYLERWQHDGATSHDEVAADHRKLVDALRGLRAAGRRRKEARALSGGIPLARQLTDIIRDEPGRERPKDFARRTREIAELRGPLDAALERAELLAGGVLAWRLSRLPWRRPPSAPPQDGVQGPAQGQPRSEPPGGDGR